MTEAFFVPALHRAIYIYDLTEYSHRLLSQLFHSRDEETVQRGVVSGQGSNVAEADLTPGLLAPWPLNNELSSHGCQYQNLHSNGHDSDKKALVAEPAVAVPPRCLTGFVSLNPHFSEGTAEVQRG